MNQRRPTILVLTTLAALCLVSSGVSLSAAEAQAPANIARAIGKIRTINGSAITLSPSSGLDISVTVQPNARILRLTPGEKDLKNATTLQLQDLQVGDTVRVRGAGSENGQSISALEVIVITAGAVAAVSDQVRQDWQKRGIAGIVDSVDSAGTIHISIPRLGGKKEVAIHTSKNTVVRRYAVDSARPENAKLSSVKEIRAGDQVRARGNRNADGTEIDAEEIFAGFFPQFSATVKSIDPNTGIVSLQDLASKKTMEVKITPESQLHKIPAELAQAFAMRLRSMTAHAVGGAQTSTARQDVAGGSQQGSSRSNNPIGQGARNAGGTNGGGRDLQQIIARLPSASLSELNLQKGDAVVVLATEGSSSVPKTAITLLSGVEPILRAAPSASDAMMLSPWTLGGAPGGDAAAQ